MFAEEEADLLISEARTAKELETMVARRVEGFPLEHIVGWAKFYGPRIFVDPGSSCRVAAASCWCGRRSCSRLRSGDRRALLRYRRDRDRLHEGAARGEFYVADIDPAAVRNADRNLGPLGGHIYEGDLYDALPKRLQGRVDVLIANAPYVPWPSSRSCRRRHARRTTRRARRWR